MTRPNAFDADFSGGYEDGDPDGYRCAEAPFGKAAGGEELDHWMFRGAEGHLEYYDGELPPKH